MHDPFEQSLREMLKAEPSNRDDDACLGRVLKTANRQVGAGDLFSLLGRWMQALMIALNSGSAHIAPVSRRKSAARPVDKAD
ncbi:CrfX protein [Pseudomonas sp. FSL R10-0056]|uniref:CrfX protein n=3 Tax=Pseudomonas TaxID=286 RepID=A0A266ZNS1_PSEFR|nr:MULTISPECIES: CrfX protein [Pseudomonas]MBO4969675.1 CrfX protein [Pseudomonas sp.]MBO5391346.1 CrfX protein [Pseudomonas sp.]MBO6275925.1 CrfX protein [Pseudomonas sp.]MBP3363191.1 CrfX protein [Pseudomonas sp.]MBP3934822.1 CrfX protein [Pseudomonas sp.]